MTRNVFTAAALVAVALAAAVNPRGAMPPLQDFNEWIYQGWLIGKILHGDAIPFGLKPWPVPNAAAQMLLGLLNVLFAPHAAGVAYLTLYLAGMTWLAAAIARTQGAFDPATFLLVLLVGGVNSAYWDGYANSQLGTGLYLVHVLRQRKGPTLPGWDLAIGLALFFCHAVVLAVFALHTVVHALQHRQLPRAAAVLLPPLGLLVWYILRDENYGEYIPPLGTSLGEFLAYKAYTAAKLGPYQNFIISGVGDADRLPALYWAGVAANLAFAGIGLAPLAIMLLQQLRRGDRSAALLTALACLAGYAVLPSAVAGVVNVGERLLILAMLVVLAWCPDPRKLRRWGAMIALLLPASIVHLHLVLPAQPTGVGIDHLTAHDPGQRTRILFWHRPFQFQRQFEAAEKGTYVPLGFTTSLVRVRPSPEVAR